MARVSRYSAGIFTPHTTGITDFSHSGSASPCSRLSRPITTPYSAPRITLDVAKKRMSVGSSSSFRIAADTDSG